MGKAYKHGVSLLALIILCVLGAGSDDVPPVADKTGAFVMCHVFVKQRLKAPSTADFSSVLDSSVIDMGGGSFSVSSSVDAQNSFGAKIQNSYVCVVSSADNGANWKLVSLDMY